MAGGGRDVLGYLGAIHDELAAVDQSQFRRRGRSATQGPGLDVIGHASAWIPYVSNQIS